jgi:hypothetical protein
MPPKRNPLPPPGPTEEPELDSLAKIYQAGKGSEQLGSQESGFDKNPNQASGSNAVTESIKPSPAPGSSSLQQTRSLLTSPAQAIKRPASKQETTERGERFFSIGGAATVNNINLTVQYNCSCKKARSDDNEGESS